MVGSDDRLILHAKKKVGYQAIEKHGGNWYITATWIEPIGKDEELCDSNSR